MESYRGLAILTTNAKDAIDTAFLRRLRFVVELPVPRRGRARRRSGGAPSPTRTPTDGLDPAALGRLNVAGGNIRNIALGAAFLAADAGEPVRMAARRAGRAAASAPKLERPLSGSEVATWR